jgi:hypothetical protein
MGTTYVENMQVKKTSEMECINNEFAIKEEITEQITVQLGTTLQYFQASADWEVLFVVKANDKMRIFNAKAEVMKWKRLNKCFYLDAYGNRDLPTLERDLAKLVGPWVKLVFQKDKLHTSTATMIASSSWTIKIAPIIFTTIKFLGIPCGREEWKPVVFIPQCPNGDCGHDRHPPIKNPPNEHTHPGNGGGSKPQDTGGTPEPLRGRNDTKRIPIQGYELGPNSDNPGPYGPWYTVFEPTNRQKAQGNDKLYIPVGASHTDTKDEFVNKLLRSGKYSTVDIKAAPEHDHEYTDQFLLRQGGAAGRLPDQPHMAREADAYQVRGVRPTSTMTQEESHYNQYGY